MTSLAPQAPSLPQRLWVYTNFDCNLSCSYCLASSSPRAPRRAITLNDFRRLIEEACDADIEEFFLTGGEPFLLPDIFDRLEYCAQRRPTTVLTNGMLLGGRRLERLRELKDLPITLQVSLDGECAPCHDAFRGAGSWSKTVAAIRCLIAAGLRVTIGATETDVNRLHIEKMGAFASELGVAEGDVFIRPLTRRGFSQDGLDLTPAELLPELTVTAEGAYWHPQSAGEAMLISRSTSPLSTALAILRTNFEAMHGAGELPRPYRCA
ncbi:MAG: radical SAM protein [Dehalococcoidia bacterium]|nr:radical SAM protein [Dehalococcoidia bacterium]